MGRILGRVKNGSKIQKVDLPLILRVEIKLKIWQKQGLCLNVKQKNTYISPENLGEFGENGET